MPDIINLCCLVDSDDSSEGIFEDTIQSVASLLRLSGLSPVISRKQILSEATNILWGAGSRHSPPLSSILEYCNSSNTIIFNMERLESDSDLVTQEYLNFLAHYKVLDYSIHNILALRRSYPLIRAEEFPLLPSPHFAYDQYSRTCEKQYHYAFYGKINLRIEEIIDGLNSHNIRVKIISDCYGASLSRELSDCMAVLNINSCDSMIFDSTQLLRPIAMGIPVISEVSKLPQLINWNLAQIKFSPVQELIKCCIEVVGNRCNEFVSAETEFLNYYHRNPALLKSIQYLVMHDK